MTSDFVCVPKPIYSASIILFCKRLERFLSMTLVFTPWDSSVIYKFFVHGEGTQESVGTWCNSADFWQVAPHMHFWKQQT